MNCVFCRIIDHEEPAIHLGKAAGVIIIQPLNPVTEGHALVIPLTHVEDALQVPAVTARTMQAAARYARSRRSLYGAYNLITSCGAAATQTVFHLHIHVVPRREGDGLALPWSAGGPGRS